VATIDQARCHKPKPSNHHGVVSPHCIQTSWSQIFLLRDLVTMGGIELVRQLQNPE
jgi:hypothetical protein